MRPNLDQSLIPRITTQGYAATRGSLPGNRKIGIGDDQTGPQENRSDHPEDDDPRTCLFYGGAQRSWAGIVQVGHLAYFPPTAACRLRSKPFGSGKGWKMHLAR
jgi:hypothetical protein